MANTDKANRVAITNIEAPATDLTEAEANMINGGAGWGDFFNIVKFAWDNRRELLAGGEALGEKVCELRRCNQPR